MIKSFTKEPLYESDVVVYLKNERTGSSTIRKCKFVGEIIDFTNTKIPKVKIRRLSPVDTFVVPDEYGDYGIDIVHSDEVVHILCSKY